MPRYSLTATVKLNDGNEMPRFGLGVYESAVGSETYNAVTYALEAGYRHIDGGRSRLMVGAQHCMLSSRSPLYS